MKLWLVTRTDSPGYDEYDGIVLRAKTEEEALAIVCGDDQNEVLIGFVGDRSNMKIERILGDGDAGIIMKSFHHG